MIDLKYIPEDLEEYYDHDEISYQGNPQFDDAMIKAGFFEYGGFRRSHRCITSKFHKTEYYDVISELTGLTKDEIAAKYKEQQEQEQEDIKELKRLAEKYGYSIIKKD